MKISKLIEEKKITKSYIIDKLKIARPTLDDWIKGNTAIGVDNLVILSSLLDVNVSYFFDEELIHNNNNVTGNNNINISGNGNKNKVMIGRTLAECETENRHLKELLKAKEEIIQILKNK